MVGKVRPSLAHLDGKVLISGKVSGLDYNLVKEHFECVELYIKTLSPKAEVINPTKICNPDWSWLHCMFVCLKHLYLCDHVCFLPDWKDSRGARIEYRFAEFLRKPKGVLSYLFADFIYRYAKVLSKK